jgi:hypothetical protein
MAKPIPNFLFHVPHMRDVIDAQELEHKMHSRNAPELVRVIDATSHKGLGKMHPNAALAKFR